MRKKNKKETGKTFEARVRIQKRLYPKGKPNESIFWGIYSCNVLSSEVKIELNGWGNFSIIGTATELFEGKEYNVVLGEIKRDKDRGDSYPLVHVKGEKLLSAKSQREFLESIITTRQYQTIIKAYPNEKILDFIMDDKAELSKLKGIGQSHIEHIKQKIRDNRELGTLINQLAPLGVTMNSIKTISDHFGSPLTATKKINESFYNLCNIKGFGFKKVDKYALTAGESPTSIHRINACVHYLLKQESSQGHSWIGEEELYQKANELLDIELIHLVEFVDTLDKTVDDDILVIPEVSNVESYYEDDEEEAQSRPYIDYNKILNINSKITLMSCYLDEVHTFQHLKRIDENYIPPMMSNVNVAISEAELELGISYTDEQRQVIKEALNCGVYVLNGSAGTGKCIKGDSLVFTDRGLLKIEDIPRYYDVDQDDNTDAKIVSYHLNGKQEVRSTSKFYNMGLSKTFKIRTKQGYEIEGTPEHPLLVVNEYGDLEFKQLQSFKGNEVIPISINNNLFGNNEILNEDLAYWLGLMVGDGSTNSINLKNHQYTLTLTNSVDEIGDAFTRIANKELDTDVYKQNDGNTFNYKIHGKFNIEYIRDVFGLPCCLSKDKYIPNTVMTAPKDIIKSFLQGLFDTDGCFSGKMFEYSTASERLAKEVHTMLLNFGIVSKLRSKKVKGYDNNTYYIISITSYQFLHKFKEEIGFKFELNKKSKLENYIDSIKAVNSNTNILTNFNSKLKDIHEHLLENDDYYTKKNKYKIKCGEDLVDIKHFKDYRVGKNGYRKSVASFNVKKIVMHRNDIPHHEYLSDVTNNMFIDYVDAIEESESVVYDFTVPETHSFVANGIINHNTTVVKGVIKACEELGLSYHACTLSGKASQVLSSKGVTASTIHRLLKFRGESFEHDEYCPLPYNVIILDEASMVNASLWKSLTQAISNGSKLIIVGDSGQLSGIGHGDVMRDLLDSQYFNGRELKQIHRQAEDSGIIEIAHKVRNGTQLTPYIYEGVDTYGLNKDTVLFTYKERNNVTEATNKIIKSQLEKINQLSTYERVQAILDFQVLVANKSSGNISTLAINKYVQSIYNPIVETEPYVIAGKYYYRKGDKVIVSGNSYEIRVYEVLDDYLEEVNKNEELDEWMLEGLSEEEILQMKQQKANQGEVVTDLFNGTIGIVEYVDEGNKALLIRFEGVDGLILMDEDNLDNLDLAYAITVHRSQGLSIKNVLFALDFTSFMLLSKQLVYTAITRSSSKCVVVAETGSLQRAIKTDGSGSRRTFMRDLLIK